MHQLLSDECELEDHEACPQTVDCAECSPPQRPCNCPCGHLAEAPVLPDGQEDQ